MCGTLGRTLAAVGLAALALAGPAGAAEGDVSLVAPGSGEVSVSADGSVVAFSTTDALVEEDRNGNQDVYVAIRSDGSTTFRLISHLPSGQSADYFSNGPEVSADGSTVAFFSLSDSLVDGDDNGRRDVFVADVATGVIRRVNVGEGGAQARAPHGLPDPRPSLSADGSLVAFTDTDQLTPDAKLTAEGNVYVRDVAAGTTRFVDTGSHASISGDGKVVAYQLGDQVYASDGDGIELISRSAQNEGDAASSEPDVNADGNLIAFTSLAANLVDGEPGKANPGFDVFVFDRARDRTRLASLTDANQPAIGEFTSPSISGDGDVVAFRADADPNGCGDPELGTVAVRDERFESTYSAARARPGELPDGIVGLGGGPSVAAGGGSVAYPALAANLVDGDDNVNWDGFVTALGKIEDPTVFTPVREARAREADKEMRFDLAVCNRAGREISSELIYSTVDGSASSESDYTEVVDAVVEIPAGTDSVGVPVPITQDDVPERCETLFLRVGGGGVLRPSRALGVIEADGPATGPVYFQRGDRIVAIRPCGEPVDIAEGREPAVSPDGERLAYVRAGADGDELVVSGADGAGARPIADGAADRFGRPAWSPDGRLVAVGEADAEDAGVTFSLHEANGESGRPVATVARAGGTLSFSPDGTKLAFDRERADHSGSDVTTLRIDDGELETLAEGITPAYGPDGSLAYVDGDAMRIRSPEGVERTFAPGKGDGDPSEFGHRRPSFSPDGTAIVFEREDSDSSGWIETAPLAGGRPTVLTPARISADHNPTWGPAGPVVPPPPTVSVTGASVTEGGEVGFSVTLSRPAAGEVSVTATTSDGTATAGSDYTARSATVTIPAGAAGAAFNVQSLQDAADEPDETVAVTLSGATGATIAGGTATGTILDDDDPPAVPPAARLLAPDAVGEGGILRVPVRLDKPWGSAVTVTLSTRNGTATAGSDFTQRIGAPLVIAAGETEAFFEVQTLSDLEPEPNESVTVEIDSVNGGTVGSPRSTSGTIVEVPPATATVRTPEAVEEGGALRFPVRLLAAADHDVRVVLSTRDGSATQPGDYTQRINAGVTIPAGQTETSFDVQTKSDLVVEGNETVDVEIEGVTGGRAGSPSTATGTIVEVSPPRVSVRAPDAVDEGGVLRFPVRLDKAAADQVTVTLSTSNGTATAGSDYTQRINDSVTIPAGQTETFFDVQTGSDLTSEPDETVNVSIDGLLGGAIVGNPSSATGTIRNLPAPAASVGTPAAVDEGQPLRFPVSISRAIGVESKVRLSTVDGSATAGSDYTARSLQEVSIPPGQTQAFFEVQTIDDPLVEPDETVKVEIRGGTNVSLGSPSSAIGTIRSTDLPPPAASVGTPATVAEGTQLKFPVTISRPLNVDAAVRLSTKDGTAKAGDDYTARSLESVTIPAGQTQATFTVDTLKDSLAESDETVMVEIRGGTNVSLGSPSSASGTITDPAPMNIVRGATLGGQVLAGTVVIKLPKTKAPLDLGGGAVLPVGTIVDATQGTIELISAVTTSKATISARTQRARFSGGVFTIRQKKGAALVTLQLSGTELRRCPTKAAVRRLEGDGKGAFAIQGRFASAAARSGRWSVEDRCAATAVKVRRGSATVRDLVRKRTRTLRAGRSLTVRKR